MVTIGTNRFPHFGQRVVRSMRSSRFFLPMAHWFHGGAGPNSPFSFQFPSKLAWRSLLWRYPSLGHRTLNNVPLDPFAFWAGKRSQVLAQRARLNRRQPHWRTASRALRTLVLCVEHWLPSQFGALSSPASHPTKADCIGSLATTSFCTKWHLGHSNWRCSKPMGPGLMRASIMRDVQREQCGRSMRVNDGPEKNMLLA